MQPETRVVLPMTGARFLAGYDHDDAFRLAGRGLEWEGDHRLVAKRAHVSERLLQLVAAVQEACTDRLAAAAAPPARGRRSGACGAAAPNSWQSAWSACIPAWATWCANGRPGITPR